MLGKIVLSAALAASAIAPAQAAPTRIAASTARTEAAVGHGAWIGALAFLLAAALVMIGYSASGDGPPASP